MTVTVIVGVVCFVVGVVAGVVAMYGLMCLRVTP